MAGVALVRGIAQSRVPAEPHAIGTMLGVGVPGLALAAILGGMVAEPARSRFLGDAQGAVLVFLVAGILALALSRQTLLDAGSGTDWRRNPAWLVLLTLLLAGVAVAAVSASLVVGPVIVTVLGVTVPTLLLVGLVVGFDRRSLRVLVLSVAIGLLVAGALRAMGARPSPGVQLPGTGITTPGDPAATAPLAIGVLLVVVAVATTATSSSPGLDAPSARAGGRPARVPLDRPRRGGAAAARGSPARAPARAAGAPRRGRGVRALLEDLASRPRLRREPGETPSEHAGRLRRTGLGALSLDLLAATTASCATAARR